METIGFIGLGIMGRPMCTNLLKAGFSVTAWNRTPSRLQPVLEAGAKAAGSPKEVAENSGIIITIVSDSPDVKQVILSDEGVIHGVKPGSVVIDMSTISPAVTRGIAAALAKKNVHMLDAPVSGGDTGAINGTLAIMVGGEETTFERCLPVFEAMGKSITRVGESGMGQTVKLCNQMLVTITNMAVCEAVTFAKASGLDPHIMIEAIKNGAAGSWQLSNLGPKMADRDFAPGFSIDLQQKDLRLALEAARETKVATPALGLVHQLFIGNQAHGEGVEGTQALVKSIERLAGK